MNKLSIITVLSFLLLTIGCIKDDFDKPDFSECYDEGLTATISIADLKTGYSGLIEDDHIIKAVVIADDETGNFYKQMVIQDSTGGIAIQVDRNDYYVNYPAGRTVYVKLKDLYINLSNGSHQIGAGLDGNFVTRIPQSLIDEHIKKGPCNDTIDISTISISDLGNDDLVNTLVRIEDVEFPDGPDGVTFADAVTSITKNRDLEDCNGNSTIVRTSGFCDFAGQTLPAGNGTIYAVYQKYNNDNQLLIRNLDDVATMTGTRCDGSNGNPVNALLDKNFEDQSVTSGGWITKVINGSDDWEINNQGSGQQGSQYCQISNFDFGTFTNSASEVWLISPEVDLAGAVNPLFSFMNAFNYDGAALEVYVSENYDGSSAPNSATWVPLNVTLDTNDQNFNWVNSTTDMSAYSSTIHIAFKYVGTDMDGATWEVDAIKITTD